MKRLIEALGGLLLLSLFSGCTSPGGAYVVGPLSSWNSKRIDKAQITRCVATSAKIAAEKKEPIIRAVSMAMGPQEIAVGYQVDMLALFDGNYTAGELATQALAATGDLAGEAAVGYAGYKALFNRSSTDTYNITVNNTGSGHTTPVVLGNTGSVEIHVGTQGGATGALTPSNL